MTRDPRRCGTPAPIPSHMPFGPYPVDAPMRVTIEVWIETDGAWDRVYQLRTGTVKEQRMIDGHPWTVVDWNG